MDRVPTSRLNRRTMIRSAAVGLLAAACTGDEAAPTDVGVGPTDPAGAAPTELAPPSPRALPSGPGTFDELPTCRLTPSAAAGPFPNREPIERSDITEGRPGTPLQLGFRVVTDECVPVAGAVVGVWHTDHTGDYSSYADGGSGKDEAEGSTFLRGVQTTDADGVVRFRSIFPGWYEGRAIHIHVGVDAPDGRSLVTQVYFDEALTGRVLADGVYAEFGQPDTSVADDFLARDPTADGTQMVAEQIQGEGGPIVNALLNLGLPA